MTTTTVLFSLLLIVILGSLIKALMDQRKEIKESYQAPVKKYVRSEPSIDWLLVYHNKQVPTKWVDSKEMTRLKTDPRFLENKSGQTTILGLYMGYKVRKQGKKLGRKAKNETISKNKTK